MSAWARAFASCEIEAAAPGVGLVSRPVLEADGVSGGECTAECGGDGRGDGWAEPWLEPAGICRGSLTLEGTCVVVSC